MLVAGTVFLADISDDNINRRFLYLHRRASLVEVRYWIEFSGESTSLQITMLINSFYTQTWTDPYGGAAALLHEWCIPITSNFSQSFCIQLDRVASGKSWRTYLTQIPLEEGSATLRQKYRTEVPTDIDESHDLE